MSLNGRLLCIAGLLLLAVIATSLWWFSKSAPPEHRQQPSNPSQAARTAPPPSQSDANRDLIEAESTPAVLIVAAVTKEPLANARITTESANASTDDRGMATNPSWSVGQAAQIHHTGHFSKLATLTSDQQIIALDQTMLVTGAILFSDGITPPPASAFRLTRVGRNTLDTGFVSERVEILANYTFRFEASAALQLSMKLTFGGVTGDIVATTQWSFPQPHIDMRATLPDEPKAAVTRVIVVNYPPEFLNAWNVRAKVVDKDWARADLLCMPAGVQAPKAATKTGGHKARGTTLTGTSARYELPLPSGRWDFHWRDLAQGITYRFPDIRVTDSDVELQLRLPALGSLRINFSGVAAKHVSLMDNPIYAQITNQQGERIASAYAADGTLSAHTRSIPAGAYFAVGLGTSPEHRMMRAAPIAVSILANQQTTLAIKLEPARAVRLFANEVLTHGVIETNAGVTVHRFKIAKNRKTAAVLAAGSYLIRYKCNGVDHVRGFTMTNSKDLSLSLP